MSYWEWHEAIGWLGVLLLVTAYGLNSFEKLKPGLLYQVLNIFGALGVGISALAKGAYPATTVEAIWILIALVAVIRIFFFRRKP